jgi:hypothetical protein
MLPLTVTHWPSLLIIWKTSGLLANGCNAHVWWVLPSQSAMTALPPSLGG